MTSRIEKDSMGEMSVPADAYWSASTARAVANFQISGERLPADFIKAVAIIKMAAAKANIQLGVLDKKTGEAIVKASKEVIDEKWDNQFPVDIFQTGSGTSTNMNVNEVIANRSCEILGGNKGDKGLCHPNDHVNKGQSSNDIIPSAIFISVIIKTHQLLLPALEKLHLSLQKKEKQFKDIIKIGRTHLMDAVPVTLGQEFSGYARQIDLSIKRIKDAGSYLLEIPLGGTALGTGLNTHQDFAMIAIKEISAFTDHRFRQSNNLFEAIASKDGALFFSGALNTLAATLMKISNDLRLLSSGPRCGINEISLPSLQPGSSIMPGKVNPVIPETVIQVAADVMGNNNSINIAVGSSLLDLNVMMPLIAYKLLRSIDLLANASTHLSEKCIDGIEANEDRCRQLVEWSMALVTPLALKIGYDKASEIAYEAHKRGKTVKEITKEKNILTDKELDDILDPKSMI